MPLDFAPSTAQLPQAFWSQVHGYNPNFPMHIVHSCLEAGVQFSMSAMFNVVARATSGKTATVQLPVQLANICKPDYPLSQGQRDLIAERVAGFLASCALSFGVPFTQQSAPVVAPAAAPTPAATSPQQVAAPAPTGPPGAVLQNLPPKWKTSASLWLPNMPEYSTAGPAVTPVSGVPLRVATHLGQYVQGFGSNAYRVVAIGPRIRLAALWAMVGSQRRLSLRVETGKGTAESADEAEVLKEYGFTENNGYWSLHVTADQIQNGRHRALMGQVIYALCEVGAFSHVLAMKSLWGAVA